MFTRSQSAILGALVADAASLGLHWIYSPERIRDVAGNAPEFMVPEASHYDGVGFYAHGGKTPGALTHYGEQMMVALRSLARTQAAWKPWDYLAEFVDTFERGGSWKGYMDHATKGTLDRAREAAQQRDERARTAAGGLDDGTIRAMMGALNTAGRTLKGEVLVRAVLDDTAPTGDTATRDSIAGVVRTWDGRRDSAVGADDKQMPAFSKLPPIVARYAGDPQMMAIAEQAIRVTNNNDTAVAFALFGARALERVICGETIANALQTALEETSGAPSELLQTALSTSKTQPADLAKEFGAACNVDMAFPVAVALLRRTPTYRDGVRQNIYASGDNAGRSIFVGAMLGAARAGSEEGIPLSWLAHLENLPEVLTMTETVCKNA